MESVGDALLLDEAWSDSPISQVDGALDTPLERPGRTVEVEGRLEEEEVSMTDWCQVRRKKGQVETEVVAGSRGREEHQKEKGQVEKDVVAGSRGWEEYQRKFPHQASIQRHMSWEKLSKCWPVKEWVEGGDESELKAGEVELVKKRERIARTRAGGEVAERGWGASEGGDVL